MPLRAVLSLPFFYRCFLLPVLTMSGKNTKIQNYKNTKMQNIIYNIQTISRIGFVYLCKKAKNRTFLGAFSH